jgi:hypothetical protein
MHMHPKRAILHAALFGYGVCNYDTLTTSKIGKNKIVYIFVQTRYV